MKVKITRTFQVNQFEPETIEYEDEVANFMAADEWENKARITMENNFITRYPHLKDKVPVIAKKYYSEPPYSNEPPIIQTQSKSQGKQSSLAEQISTSPNLTILKTYEFLLKNSTDKDAKKSYEKRLDELMSQTIK